MSTRGAQSAQSDTPPDDCTRLRPLPRSGSALTTQDSLGNAVAASFLWHSVKEVVRAAHPPTTAPAAQREQRSRDLPPPIQLRIRADRCPFTLPVRGGLLAVVR